jgi:hypothetical protein
MAIRFIREGKTLHVDDQYNYLQDYSNPGYATVTLDQVGQWCYENHCGRRTSYDTFKFRNEKDMTAFLLKWG